MNTALGFHAADWLLVTEMARLFEAPAPTRIPLVSARSQPSSPAALLALIPFLAPHC
jgi:hypothetical protein